MQRAITINISDDKLSAINLALSSKNTNLQTEIEKFVEQTYQKAVPQSVRDYIDMITATRLSKRPGRRPKVVSQSANDVETEVISNNYEN